LDDLEEFLAETSPVILRKNRTAEVYGKDTNPFIGDNAAVHKTQLSVSASLLAGGMAIECWTVFGMSAIGGTAEGCEELCTRI
jgi:hypothetical protein